MKVLAVILNIIGILFIVASITVVSSIVADWYPYGPIIVFATLMFGVLVFYGGYELRNRVNSS